MEQEPKDDRWPEPPPDMDLTVKVIRHGDSASWAKDTSPVKRVASICFTKEQREYLETCPKSPMDLLWEWMVGQDKVISNPSSDG